MKKLIKNEICESVNSARMYCSRKTGQKLRLLFIYRTWTVAASGEKTREKKKRKKKENAKHTLSVCLDPRFEPTSAFCFFFFFFFFTRFGKTRLLFMYCSMNSNNKCWLFCSKQCIMYCSWTHKFHFLATFSLKMGPTLLFTHLKIILLQWFQQ